MAHNFSLNETLVVALAAQLTAQLPPAVTTVNASVTDGYKIVNPAKVYDHVPLLSTLAGAGFPAVAIQDMGTTFQDDLVYSVGATHRLAIVVFISNPDPEALAWQLRRYQQAVMIAIQFDRKLGKGGSDAWTTRLGGIDPGPMLGPSDRPNTSGDNTYLSWFALEIECPRTEV